MATHSSTLAWRIPWTEEPGGLQSMGQKEPDTTERLTLSHSILPMFWEILIVTHQFFIKTGKLFA